MNSMVREPNVLLRLLGTIVPGQVVEFWLGQINGLWSLDQARARIISREPAADGSVTLVLKHNRHFLGFRPGQHVNVGVEIDGKRYTRSYSPTDVPNRSRRISITVRAIASGKVSNFLQNVRVGTIVTLGQAFGELQVPQQQDHDNARTLILAAGSGITPMLALIREQAAKHFPQPLHLKYWARTRGEIIAQAELMARQCENFLVEFFVTGEGSPRIDANELISDVQGHPHVLACGPHGFVETARRYATDIAASFKAEYFTPPPSETAEPNGVANVTLLKTGKTVQVPKGMPLLQALEEQGLSPPHGCRMGICNTCTCAKPQGIVRNVLDGEVFREPSQSVKICVHTAQSDITLDL